MHRALLRGNAGTEIKVQRRTYDREDKANRANNVYAVTRGISFTVKNTGREPAAEGEVEWAILVVRPPDGKTSPEFGNGNAAGARVREDGGV